MSDLFASDPPPQRLPEPSADEPLAARMRPRTLDEIAGQQHILAEGKLLRRAIESDRFTSLIFYGPPGTGKTTLASVIARSTGSRFESLNGVESNVAEIRAKIDQARTMRDLRGQTTVLFIDEIHRFNKAQQDVLLPHIERATVRFIGATTHNPYFYVNSPLVSRSQIFQLEGVATDDLIPVLERAIADKDHGLGHLPIQADPDALRHLAEMSDGDVRRALTALELSILTTPPRAVDLRSTDPTSAVDLRSTDSSSDVDLRSTDNSSDVDLRSTDNSSDVDLRSTDPTIHLTLAVAEESIQRKAIVYDADGDAHYDTASAFIKSIRGSDPDAALYWLAKMLTAGEDPRFIARRLVISASEDIGLADSNALRVAMDAHQAFEFIGMPEGRIPLAHATVYLATAPKSNSAYAALGAAIKDVEGGRTLAVPEHLRTKTRKKLASASGTDDAQLKYLYSHDYEGGYVPQAYLPDGRKYYTPTENGLEKRIKERLDHWRSLHKP